MVNTLGVENEAKQTIEALQAELQKTKERLQAVEELKSQSGKFLIVDLFLVFHTGIGTSLPFSLILTTNFTTSWKSMSYFLAVVLL